MTIRAIRFSFSLTALGTLSLPDYIGSTLRGGFGHAFKRVACTFKGKPCDNCLLKHRCVYAYIFETLPPEDSVMMRKYRRAPHPFIIEPPAVSPQKVEPGEPLEFNLVLIGRGIEYLPYFIYAFEELGKMGIGRGKGKYRLERVTCGAETIYEGSSQVMKPVSSGDTPIFPPVDMAEDRIRINFSTPTRIVRDEKLVDAPTFQDIFRTLLRRISLLSYFHCGKELDVDYKGLIDKSGLIETTSSNLVWHDWERWSSRQEERMLLGGFMGTITCSGNLRDFLQFLVFGEHIHVGKGTGFGLGRYEIMKGGDA